MTPAARDWRHGFARLDSLSEKATKAQFSQRGKDFESVLHGMLQEAGTDPRLSFRPRGEEIDGSFLIDGRPMLLEAKWVKRPIPASSLYSFVGKVDGKLVGTLGLFISMNGFSDNAADALTKGKQLNVILMDGEEVRAVAGEEIDFSTALRSKLRAAAETGAPFFSVAPTTSASLAHSTVARRKLAIVEGATDARILSTLLRFGTTDEWAVAQSHGQLNLARVAAAMADTHRGWDLVIVTDGDGAPDVARKRIRLELDRLAPHLQPALNVLNPDLERSLHVRPARGETDTQLASALAAGIARAVQEGSPDVAELLQSLDIPRSSFV